MVVFLSPDQILILDHVGAQVWAAADDGCTPDEIAAALAPPALAPSLDLQRQIAALIALHHGRQSHADATAAQSQLRGRDADWAAAWRCRLGETIVDVVVEDPAHVDIAHYWIAPFADASVAPAGNHVAIRSDHGVPVIVVNGRETGRQHLVRHLHLALMSLVWPDHPLCAYLHAGAVSMEGKYICLPGVSGSGKTTLIANLTSRGSGFLSDDCVAVTMSGALVPWPMPLRVKEPSWPVVGASYPALWSIPSVDDVATRVRRMPLSTDAWMRGPQPTSLIVFPRYVSGGAVQTERLTPFDVLRRLVEAEMLLVAPIDVQRATDFLNWVSTTPAYTLSYGDLDDAHRELGRLSAAH